MKTKSLSQIKKGELFKASKYDDSILEMCFTVKNGGYGGKEKGGTLAFVIKKEGFAVSFHQIYRADEDTVLLIEGDDLKYLSEVEDRIRKIAKYSELYKLAEENSDGENLLGAYYSSAKYGEHRFERGDIVKDCHGRIGTVLGADGYAMVVIKKVHYRVAIEGYGSKGIGIFSEEEIEKIGRMDDIKDLEQ